MVKIIVQTEADFDIEHVDLSELLRDALTEFVLKRVRDGGEEGYVERGYSQLLLPEELPAKVAEVRRRVSVAKLLRGAVVEHRRVG